jgi:LmbE family N-acetylglucosaminyl deacetylase
MQTLKTDFGRSLARWTGLLCLLLLGTCAISQRKLSTPAEPLPQDTGKLGLQQMLLRLQTTARFMQTVAHPDDEDGGVLTLVSRGQGATVTLMTLNRGEGGQNKIGSNLFDVLGVLRTLELTASDRHYGAQQRFTRVADFGYSKSPEETFQKWHGHDIPLGDMVRVIRTFRPDVLVARFSGTSRDGHGHHEASGLLTVEAFRAAADAKRFPEQLKEGLTPWQVKKLYVGNVCGFSAASCADGNYTVRLNTGEVNQALGMSYVQFAMEGLRHQLSQGAGGWSVEPGPRYAYYKLVDTATGKPTSTSHEKDFFDGIDTTLPGLASRLGTEENTVPFLRRALVEIAKTVESAGKDPEHAADPLFKVREKFSGLLSQIERSGLSGAAKADLVERLKEKLTQAETAVNFACGVSLSAVAVIPYDGSAVVSPGQDVMLVAGLSNRGKSAVHIKSWQLEGFEEEKPEDRRTITVEPGNDQSMKFMVKVPADARYTRPYWHRNNPERDALNTIDDPKYVTLPFPPPVFHVRARYEIAGKGTSEISSDVAVSPEEKGDGVPRKLAVGPIFSVMLEPGEQVIPVNSTSARPVKVAVSTNREGAPRATLHLEAPDGWKVEPVSIAVDLQHRGEMKEFDFKVSPSKLIEGRAEIRAVVEAGGKSYSEGYSTVGREDLGTFYYYQPAIQRVSVVDVKIPKDLRVGYIMGAGDEIPTVLRQTGMNVTVITADKLGAENLQAYGTLVLGIRAYDTQKEIAENNKRLLDFVSSGGTLVVQYNAGTGDFNSGHFTPYPADLSRTRVSVEEAPVEILAPDDSVFRSPNLISEKDFDGWVQERGLYFMDQWDDRFKPLLSSHDPEEQAQKGGLLRAPYGKGTYIYAGYAFFRQLPAGVPGAIRLYVNLLSAGH